MRKTVDKISQDIHSVDFINSVILGAWKPSRQHQKQWDPAGWPKRLPWAPHNIWSQNFRLAIRDAGHADINAQISDSVAEHSPLSPNKLGRYPIAFGQWPEGARALGQCRSAPKKCLRALAHCHKARGLCPGALEAVRRLLDSVRVLSDTVSELSTAPKHCPQSPGHCPSAPGHCWRSSGQIAS